MSTKKGNDGCLSGCGTTLLLVLILLYALAVVVAVFVKPDNKQESFFESWRGKQTEKRLRAEEEQLDVEFDNLPTDHSGYIQVKNGQRIGFPFYNSRTDPQLFCLKDVFEIVGVVGSPESGLVNFDRNQITLVLKNYNADFPQFFLFQWLGNESEKENSEVAELRKMFEAGVFFDQNGQTKTKSTGFFLYVSGRRIWKGICGSEFGINEVRRISHLVVGQMDNADAGLYAKIFDPGDEGKLTILAKDGSPSDGQGLVKTTIIKETDTKFVLDPKSHLPNPLDDWLDEISDQLGGGKIVWDESVSQ